MDILISSFLDGHVYWLRISGKKFHKLKLSQMNFEFTEEQLMIRQAARDFSIDPNAKQTLGEMGWVVKGTGFPELDKETFSLEPDMMGGRWNRRPAGTW